MKIAVYVFTSHKDRESTSFRACDFIMAFPEFRLDITKAIPAVKCRFRLERSRSQIAERTRSSGQLFEVSFRLEPVQATM
jgi:hypothetical protein